MLMRTSSADATPRPAKMASALGDRKEIPWPALTKLSPANLKRTASTLMGEWEESLTPPTSAGSEDSSLSHKWKCSDKGEDDGLM